MHSTFKYSACYDELETLDPSILFESTKPLLFDIPTLNKRIVDLCMDDFITSYLDRTIEGTHEAIRIFNIVTNTFNLFFTNSYNLISF